MKSNWSMYRKRRFSRSRAAAIRAALRWTLFSAVLLIFFLFLGNPFVRGFCPLLIIPLATAVAMHEGDLAAGIFGVFCGLMIDMANGVTLLGFSSLWLLIACPLISLFTRFCVNENVLSHFMMNLIVCGIMAVMDMLFLHWVWEGKQSGISFVRTILPAYGGAVLFSAPIYWLVSLIRRKLTVKEQHRLEISAQNAEEAEYNSED